MEPFVLDRVTMVHSSVISTTNEVMTLENYELIQIFLLQFSFA